MLRPARGLSTLAAVTAIAFAASAFQVEIDGTAPAASDRSNALAVDSAGDVLAAGTLQNATNDFVVVKTDGTTGAELWRNEIDGTLPGAFDTANDVEVDQIDDVVAVGRFGDALSGGVSFFAVKFDGTTGTETFRTSIVGTDPSNVSTANAVAIAPFLSTIYAGGVLANAGTGQDATVIALDPFGGLELWRASFDGTTFGSADAINSVTVDPFSNVAAGGILDDFPTGPDAFLVGLDAVTGGELWRASFDGTASSADAILSVASTPGGETIGAGQLRNFTTGNDFFVVAVDAAGFERWRTEIDGGANGVDFAVDVATNPFGQVAAAGFVTTATEGQNGLVVLLDSTGVELWRTEIAGLAPAGNDALQTVSFDGVGDVLVAGTVDNGGASGPDFVAIKLDGASGAELWRRNVDGTSMGIDGGATGLVVDLADDPIVGGSLLNGDQDFTIIKLDGTSGSLFVPAGPVCGDGTLDAGEQCDDGNLVDGDGCSSTCAIEPAAAACDADGDGAFDLDDLFTFVANRFLPATPPLDVFDQDGSGFLDRGDLQLCIAGCVDDDCTRFTNAVLSFVIRR